MYYEVSFYGYDGHGSVRFLTDSTGTITDTYDYDAFGNIIIQTGSTPNNYLYAGEQFDSDLNLYYNRARYLDVNRGRFWSQDSFEGNEDEPLSLHKYLYANADPVNKIDITGKSAQAVALVSQVQITSLILATIPTILVLGVILRSKINIVEKIEKDAEEKCGSGGGIILYRSMKADTDFFPVVEQTARGLGVRSPEDIRPDEAGQVYPNTGGMSIAPVTPTNLPPFRKPNFLPGGTGKDDLFCINSNFIYLGGGLQYRQDSTTHGLVEPNNKMLLQTYRDYLAQTRLFWKKLFSKQLAAF